MKLNTPTKKTPLLELAELGQSIWLDYTRRDLILSGELRRLIEEDGLRGMTSNPSIFEKATVLYSQNKVGY
jgi:transaldolase